MILPVTEGKVGDVESLGLPSPLELLVSHGNVSGDMQLIMAGPESADMQHLVPGHEAQLLVRLAGSV